MKQDSEVVESPPRSLDGWLVADGDPGEEARAWAATRQVPTPGRWRRPAMVGVLVAVALLFTVAVIRSSVEVYLTPDGAHYLADADALFGGGVRPLRHPPLFPALVLGSRAVLGDVAGVQAAMLAALALLVVGLYVLLRRWIGHWPSLLAAALGALLPTTAELLGWGGGATLLGMAFLALALAGMEAWIERGGYRGLAVGAALGLAALSHPFVFAVAGVCLGVRWAVLLAERRRLGWGWDPLGVRGILTLALPVVPALVASLPYYLGVESGSGFHLRLPDPAGLSELLMWAFGPSPLPWVLLLIGLLGAMLSPFRGPVVYAACIGGLTLFMATSLEADPSYVSRVAYLFPVLAAPGIAVAAERVGRWMPRATASLPRPRVFVASLGVVVVAALALSSYGPRLATATRFYRLLEAEDVAALKALRDGEGTVATSWHDTRYGTGVSTSWFLEGLADRSAFGPTGPWLSNVREQQEAGLDMQRLFAGTEGLENGALQIAAGPPGVRADPAIQVWSEGFYFPVLFGNSLVNAYPAPGPVSSWREVDGSEVRWSFRDDSGRVILTETAALEGREAVIRYEVPPEVRPGDWSLWFWPAYGVHWKDVQTGPGWVEARQGLPEEEIAFRLSAERAEVAYRPVEDRFRVEAIEVRASSTSAVTVRIEVQARAAPGNLASFGEEEILARYDLSDVVVWKNTGWGDRFDGSPCYAQAVETRSLLIYRVAAGCIRRAEG